MSSRKKAQAAFVSATLLLLLSAVAAYVAINRLQEGERWLVHTHEVQAAIGDIDSAFLKAGRARSAYMFSDDQDFIHQFEMAASDIPNKFKVLRDLVADNPKQIAACTRLEDLTNQRIELLRRSMVLKKVSPGDVQGQNDLARPGVPISAEMTSIMEQLRQTEQELLDRRGRISHHLFLETVAVLAVSFALSLGLLAMHYRFLTRELAARETAELVANASEESLRRLTGRLLQLQDEERRKFSRELHDSLGQYLAGVKMNLDMFNERRADHLLSEAIKLLEQAINETRTISHLLHPPLLDEAGFSSAARWYLEGFSQRSGIEIKIDLPEETVRLPKAVALGLFRILQEGLTNIHRHAASPKADVTLVLLRDQAVLKVRDYGRGIALESLGDGRDQGIVSGVGLAGMRERMRELGGHVSIKPCTPGTLILATLPLPAAENAEGTRAPANVQLGK